MAKKRLLDRHVFDAALKVATNLLVDGGLWWRLSTGGVIARLDGDKVTEYFKDQPDEQKRFEKALFTEVVPALNEALARGKRSFSISVSADADEETPSDPDTVEDKKARHDEHRSRVEAVANAFADAELRERVLVRRTSKGCALDEIRWDIRTKRHDLKEGPLPGVAFATLEFVLSRKPDIYAQPPGFLEVFGLDSTTSMQFDCHLKDLDGMIRDLQALRDNLAAVPKDKIQGEQ